MKKLITLIVMISLVFSLSAADPVTLFGLLTPGLAYSGETLESETLDTFATATPLYGLVATSKLNRIGFDSVALFSGDINDIAANLEKNTDVLLQTGLSLMALESVDVESAKGSITLTPDLSEIMALRASFIVDYDNFSMMYYIGARTEILELDGTVKLTVDLSDDSLLSVSVSAEDLTINGDASLSNSSAGLKVFFDYDKVNKWMNFLGYDFAELRFMTAQMLVGINELAMIGLDTSSAEAIITSCEEKNIIDILDAATFLLTADSKYYMNELRMAAMGFSPVIYINGEPVEEIHLKALMDTLLDFAYIADSI
ncbi:MAG: hypothetical protein IAA97_00350 [Spirochaetes bacterium]|uniref:Uncharacterized protein n=1 Tax=Candidatus Ornithospirochaeta stercoripullorum TaxID=2840899 RepID=A0A9D9DZJ9_9SPIO|nr:hypothetical protein [Candidatus Ornithospirochaeta stercoripullorum]